MYVEILVGISVCLVVYELFSARKNKEYGNKIPGPARLPIIGNSLMFLGDGYEFLKTIITLSKTFGVKLRVFIGNDLFVLLNGAKDVEVLMSSSVHVDKADEYKFLHPWLATGLLTSNGSKWRNRRKMLTPAFHFKILDNFIPILEKNTNTFIKKLAVHAGKEKFDVFKPVTLCTLDAISESAMGVSVNAQEDGSSKYALAIKQVSAILMKRMKHVLFRFDFFFYFSKDYRKLYNSLKTIHDHANNVIKKRRLMIENGEVDFEMSEENIEIGQKKRLAFLDLLIMSTIDGEKLDNDAIREEVNTFMFAGHDSTTSGISFALYTIASNEHVQNRLYEEQNTIFGEDIKRPTKYTDLSEMKYLEATIKESLRLYPPVPIIARKLNTDAKINDMLLPADTCVIANLYQLHRDPEVFPVPEAFIPDRFLHEDIIKKNAYTYIPFSAGQRNCVGQRYAMMEMKMLISKIIRNYKLIPVQDELKLSADLILTSKTGINIKISKR